MRPQATWEGALGDHAWIRTRIPAERQRSQFRAPTTWIPRSGEDPPRESAANWAATLAPAQPPLTWEELFDVLREVQQRTEDPERKTCKERRTQRESAEIK